MNSIRSSNALSSGEDGDFWVSQREEFGSQADTLPRAIEECDLLLVIGLQTRGWRGRLNKRPGTR